MQNEVMTQVYEMLKRHPDKEYRPAMVEKALNIQIKPSIWNRLALENKVKYNVNTHTYKYNPT